MPDKPPYYPQETYYSCAPACLRMVLANFGVIKEEEELRDLSHCTFLGTGELELVDAAKSLGFDLTRKYTIYGDGNLEELKAQIESGLFPIVHIKVRLGQNQRPQKHAVVVVRITQEIVEVLDPIRGELTCSIEDFMREWNATKGLTILVEKS